VRGLYLDSQRSLLKPPAGIERPLVYANFVTSLDGRIAVGATEADTHVPPSMTTRADWRLFQELQAHADAVITHGAYLRALAHGRLGNILQVGTRADAADLLDWRHAHGMHAQPAVIIASRTLDFELPASLEQHQQRLIILTTEQASTKRVEALREAGIPVSVTSGSGHVPARDLVNAAASLGCRKVYLQSGPVVLGDMLRSGLLARLYLTISAQLIGGNAFHSLVTGDTLGLHGALQMESLHLLAGDEGIPAQLFGAFSCRGAHKAPS
jgi:riboflavin biosynthesis pyrimidine reductase